MIHKIFRRSIDASTRVWLPCCPNLKKNARSPRLHPHNFIAQARFFTQPPNPCRKAINLTHSIPFLCRSQTSILSCATSTTLTIRQYYAYRLAYRIPLSCHSQTSILTCATSTTLTLRQYYAYRLAYRTCLSNNFQIGLLRVNVD